MCCNVKGIQTCGVGYLEKLSHFCCNVEDIQKCGVFSNVESAQLCVGISYSNVEGH